MLFVLFGYLVFVKRDFTGNLKIRLVFSFLGIFTPVVTAFPLALGYSGINVPNRCEFVLDMSIIITAFNLAFTLGILIAKRIKEQLKGNRSSDNDSGGKCLLDAGWFWSTGHKNHRNFERIAGWNI